VKTLKLAIIGFGFVGEWHYNMICEDASQLEVVGVWDVREEALDNAVKHGLHTYSSEQELISDENLDLVIVATPNNFHKDLSIACMRAGKNVICEKPVTMNASELMEMMAVAGETGKLLTIHHQRRWDKDYLTVKKVLDDKIIGDAYFIESRVQGSRRLMHGWRSYKVNGGGMVLDWGVHLLDQVMLLTDSPVVSVGAHLLSVFTPEVEDNIKIFLRFENGISAVLEMSTNCLINLPRWHVSCLEGTMTVDDWSAGGKIVKLKADCETAWENDIVYTEAGPTRTMASRPAHTTEQHTLPEVAEGKSVFYDNVVDVLLNGAEPLVTPAQCLRVMQVIDLIFEANEAGETKKCRI